MLAPTLSVVLQPTCGSPAVPTMAVEGRTGVGEGGGLIVPVVVRIVLVRETVRETAELAVVDPRGLFAVTTARMVWLTSRRLNLYRRRRAPRIAMQWPPARLQSSQR